MLCRLRGQAAAPGLAGQRVRRPGTLRRGRIERRLPRSSRSSSSAPRKELASTGQAGLVARAELTRCAVRLASLDLSPCDGFEALRNAPRQRAGLCRLPRRPYRAGVGAVATAASRPGQRAEDAAAVDAIGDPLSRLVAAGVLFRRGAPAPRCCVGGDTASEQGWRRPLFAWLGVQAKRAEHAGAVEEAERIRRRMALVTGTP